VWNQQENDGSSCVVVEHWANNQVERDFIVPATDPDCDSIQQECDPGGYLGSRLDGPTCLVAPANDGPSNACRLGAFGCTDKDGPNNLCASLRDEVCVPEVFCGCPLPTPTDDCLRGKLEGQAERVPHIACTIRVNVAEVCDSDSDPIDLRGRLGNDGCEPPRMSPLRLNELASPSRSRNFGGIDLELISQDPACGFAVQINTGRHLPGTEFGAIRLKNRAGAVLVPIRFDFVPDVLCMPRPMDCRAVNFDVDDPMWACVQ
jgi:hypothetical protein